VIRNRWVFSEKSDGKQRACPCGEKAFLKLKELDYEEIFSPVIRYETIRLMFALIALENMYMNRSGMLTTAFLYGKLKEEIYMKQPEGLLS